VRFHNLRTVVNRDGDLVATNRNGEIVVVDDRGRERERYPVVYGAKVKVKVEPDKPAPRVKAGAVLVEWDPHTTPILTEFTGKVQYVDIVEERDAQEAAKRGEATTSATVREEFDEVTDWPARSSSRISTPVCSRGHHHGIGPGLAGGYA
jgi:DNA-directed RNA polymerase subunit beta'